MPPAAVYIYLKHHLKCSVPSVFKVMTSLNDKVKCEKTD